MWHKSNMISPTTQEAVNEAARILSELLNRKSSLKTAQTIDLELKEHGGAVLDAFIELNGVTFIVEYKQSGNLRSVEQGINQLQGFGARAGEIVKLLVVPYMTETGQDRCQSAGISWLDLSGNADIIGPGIRISVHGRRNLYKRPGRPRNPFAPKSSRVARMMLYGDRTEYEQSELVEITKLDKGHLSRVIHSLEEGGLINRKPGGAILVSDHGLLLDSWHEAYDFSKHSIIRGHIPARTGLSLARRISDELDQESIEYALTGLASAWLYTRFSNFRTVTVFLASGLSAAMLDEIGFAERESGANTWLVVPNDSSVLWESQVREKMRTVHPIQAYLDLKYQPERAADAAEELKKLALARFSAD